MPSPPPADVLHSAGMRARKSSTAAATASAATAVSTTSRLQPRDEPDGDAWDGAWGDDDEDDAFDDGGGGGGPGHAGGRDDNAMLFDDDSGGGSGSSSSSRSRSRSRSSSSRNSSLDARLADEEAGLAGRAARRPGRLSLDQRFVPSASHAGAEFGFGDGRLVLDDPQSSRIMAALTADERKAADRTVAGRLLRNGALIGLWYLFSLSLSLYNKWMFGGAFPFPVFTTSAHMLVQFLLASLVLYFVPSLRPVGGFGRRGSADGEPAMTRWFYLTRIGPCGAATGLDIGLGNASLKFISLTFYTMCKSSSLAFVLLFAFAFRLETPTVRLVGIIATMTVGVVMMVAGEVEFVAKGFFLVIAAAFFSGFRWALTQIMLLRNPATSNPFSSIFYLAPVMFVALFVLAVPVEGFGALADGLGALAEKYGSLRAPLLVLAPGAVAFLMTASEFALLQRTSVVTLSIAGIFKEVLTIVTSALVFHDILTLVNVLGLAVTLATMGVYNYIKITKMRHQAQIEVHKEHQQHPQLPLDELPPPSTGPTTFGPGLAAAAAASSSSAGPAAADHDDSDSDGDGDGDGDGDAEHAGLLPKP